MRALVAALCLVTVALPGAAGAAGAGPAQAPGPPPVDGTWVLTFTTASVRTVGDSLGRDGRGAGCAASQCVASYRFSEPDPGQQENLVLRLDASGCAAPPCELRATADGDYGFAGPVTYDGSVYRATGRWFYPSAHQVTEHLDGVEDTLTFTVSGLPDDPVLSGELTGVFGYVGPTGEDGGHTDVTGYELYSGTVTGRPSPDTAQRLRDRAGPGAPAAGPGSSGATRAGGSAAAGSDEAAARAHSRPVLSTRVATPADLPWRPSAVAVSALLALLLVVLMPFPAALFNATLEENYGTVRGWLRLGRRPAPDADADADVAADVAARPGWPRFLLLVSAVAVLGAFLDPGLGLDAASLVLVAGLAVAALALTLFGVLPGHLYVRRRYGEGARLALYPLGLGIAALCVLVSRLTSFEPGYLYGVVAGFGFARELRTDERGRLSLATSGALLVLAGAAFALRVPVHDAVLDGGGWPLVLLDTVLAALFAAGVEANVLGLLPLRFLPGETLYRWSRAGWGAVFGLNVFVFVHALSAAAGGASTGASVTVAAALFGAFAAVSVAFWAYFRFRPAPPLPVGTD